MNTIEPKKAVGATGRPAGLRVAAAAVIAAQSMAREAAESKFSVRICWRNTNSCTEC